MEIEARKALLGRLPAVNSYPYLQRLYDCGMAECGTARLGFIRIDERG